MLPMLTCVTSSGMDCYSTSLVRSVETIIKSGSDCFCFPLKHNHNWGGQSKQNVVANSNSSVGVDAGSGLTFQLTSIDS